MELANAGAALKAGLRHAIFAEILAGDASADLDAAKERLDDERADLNAVNADTRKALARSRIARAEDRLSRARAHKGRVRKLLWPADAPETTDG